MVTNVWSLSNFFFKNHLATNVATFKMYLATFSNFWKVPQMLKRTNFHSQWHTQMRRLSGCSAKWEIECHCTLSTPYSWCGKDWSWLVEPVTSINYQVKFCSSLAPQQHTASRTLHPLLLVPAQWQCSWTVKMKRITLPIYDSSYLRMLGVDFLELVETHSWWWQCALQCEREQRQYLEETIEQLASQAAQPPGESWRGA